MANNVGVQMYTVRDYVKDKESLISTLQKIKALGYDVIQSGTPRFLKCEEFKEILDSLGMCTCSADGSYENMLSDVSKNIKEAKILNVNYIGIGTIPEKLRTTADGYRQFARDMTKIGKALKNEGIYIIYHNHALEFASFGGYTGMDILLEDSCPECVQFTLDTHWLQLGGVDPAEYIKKAKGRVDIIHFKDYGMDPLLTEKDWTPRIFMEIGQGNLDFKKIKAACDCAGTKYFIVEQDICKIDPFTSLKTSYDYISGNLF